MEEITHSEAIDALDALDGDLTSQDISIGYEATISGQLYPTLKIEDSIIEFDGPQDAREFCTRLEASQAEFEHIALLAKTIRRLADGIDPSCDVLPEEAAYEGILEADDGEPVFPISLKAATPKDYSTLLAGLGQLIIVSASHQADRTAHYTSDLLDRMMIENREASRYLLLKEDFGRPKLLHSLPDRLTDALDIEVVDGEAIDAENRVNIEIE